MKKALFFSGIVLSICLASFRIVKTEESTLMTREKVDFKDFLLQFPKGELPFAITKDEMSTFLTEVIIKKKTQSTEATERPTMLSHESYNYLPLLETSKFSRMPVRGEPVKYFETASNYAVIYNLNRGYGKGRKNYCITVFDKNGNHVSSYFMAQLLQYNEFTTATLNKDLVMTLEKYDVEWENDYAELGFENNKITGLKIKGSHVIDLTKKQDKKKIGELPPSVPKVEKGVKQNNSI